MIAASLFMAAGCSSSSTESDTSDGPDTSEGGTIIDSSSTGQSLAFVSTRADDFSSGELVRISLSEDNIITGIYPATDYEIDVDTDGFNVYQIGHSNVDSVTRFDPLDTSIEDYQLSVSGDDAAPVKPQDLVFIDETKGYLTRRGSEKLWIIDPEPDNAPATVEDFLIAEIDLGHYDIDLPNMTDALIVDDKLFVLLEMLNELPDGTQVPDEPGYLAVFDTRTDTEIDTGQGSGGLKGIMLLVTNPTSLQYNESNGQIYVIGRGNFIESTAITDDFYSGGVETIDPTTYQHTLLLDDGTAADNNGYFLNGVIVTDTLGYLITLDNAEESSTQLRTFNPETGKLGEPITNIISAAESLTMLAIGPDNHLWIGISAQSPGFARIDLQTGQIAPERVATTLTPNGISFLSVRE